MVTLTIDGREVVVEPGTTILQACKKLDIEIPVFCYHDRLSVAGNCRMCLVEVEKSPKPVASCCMPVMEGMVVHTNSKQTEKSRKNTLEFLLINHPLDCPICDQGGECDLQDLTLNYGRGSSRFDLNKRAVTDKHMGPLVKTVMTRCIHCTRCIRFAKEIAGIEEIGILHRGEHAEVTSYLEKTLHSELSGNVIDLCPVGALTSKPYAFHGRSWELEHTDSISVQDAVGAHIRIDHAHRHVMRIVPRECNDINQEWLDDRARFSYDGLHIQRIDQPYVRINGKLKASSWKVAFDHISKALHKKPGNQIAALAGDMADCESMLTLKLLMNGLKSNSYDCRPLDAFLPIDHPSHYLFNSRITGIDQMDALLIVGSNPRVEAPVLNARIGEMVRKGKLKVALIGPMVDLTYPYEYLGESPTHLAEVAEGKVNFAKVLKAASKPAIILGIGAMQRRDASAIFEKAQMLAHNYSMISPEWNGFNILHTQASTVGGMSLGFVNESQSGVDILELAQNGALRFLYLLGFDHLPKDFKKHSNCFVVYQGHHGDVAAQSADVVLPGCSFVEKNATYINLEGRVQKTHKATEMLGEAKTDWRIVRAVSEMIALKINIDDDEQMQQALCEANVCFKTGMVEIQPWKDFKSKTPQRLDAKNFILPISNFYMNDVISKNSPTMAKCVTEILSQKVAA